MPPRRNPLRRPSVPRRTRIDLNFRPSHVGVAAGVGVETRWHGFKIAPVLRYTRWAPDYGQAFFTSLQNQVELLLAVSRSPESYRRPLGRRFSFGPIVGWGLTADLPSTPFLVDSGGAGLYPASTGLTSPLVGADVEVALPRGFSAEIDAFYKPMRSQSVSEFQGQVSRGSQATYRYTDFEFPRAGQVPVSDGWLQSLPRSRAVLSPGLLRRFRIWRNGGRGRGIPVARGPHRAGAAVHPLAHGRVWEKLSTERGRRSCERPFWRRSSVDSPGPPTACARRTVRPRNRT